MSAFNVSKESGRQPGDFFEDAELPECGADEPVIAQMPGNDLNALIDGFSEGLRRVFQAAVRHCVPGVSVMSKAVSAMSEVSRRLGF